MKKKLIALTACSLIGSSIFAGYYPVDPNILSFQRYSKQPIKNRLMLPEKDPGLFSLNDGGNTFMSRSFYVTKELSDKTIKEFLIKTEGKKSVGLVPLELKDTIKNLETNGFKRHVEEAGDIMQLMSLEIEKNKVTEVEDLLKKLKEKNKITVIRAQSIDELKIWVKTATEAFKMWNMTKKDIATYVQSVLDNSDDKKGGNTYFYIGYLDKNPVTVALAIHYKEEQIAYGSWGGTIEEYRKKGVLKAVCITGIINAFLNGIKTGFSMSQPDAVAIHKKLGFQEVKNGQYYWYMYHAQSWFSSIACTML